MKTKRFLQAVVVLCCLGMMVGCATAGGGATAKGVDEKTAIASTLGDWGSALASKNVDSILAFYSDAFRDQEGRDKATLKRFLEEVIANGYLDGAKVDVASAQISVNGEEAVVAPLTLSGDMGAVSLSLSMKKEAGSWRIVSSSMA